MDLGRHGSAMPDHDFVGQDQSTSCPSQGIPSLGDVDTLFFFFFFFSPFVLEIVFAVFALSRCAGLRVPAIVHAVGADWSARVSNCATVARVWVAGCAARSC